jgi:hypothetical protein
MSLPAKWTDRIFDKLTIVYGSHFLSRWAGLNIADVKADWSHELRGFAEQPDAIRFGLENLPADQPPTVLQFRAICNRRPDPGLPKLPPPAPGAQPEQVAKRIAKVTENAMSGIHPRQWAFNLRRREQGGERLSMVQRHAWRSVLGESTTQPEGAAA